MSTTNLAVLICLSGLDTEEFIRRAAPHVPVDRPLVLLYVIDTRPVQELGYIARRLHSTPRAMHGREALISAADEPVAAAVLEEAQAVCRELGHGGSAPITPLTRRGRPEQEILAAARQPDLGIGLLVIGSSYKRGPGPIMGPASLGHVAHFIVDHSPCDVLLLR